jgi:single-stranded DNA-specific DHH superfamily exonuclease
MNTHINEEKINGIKTKIMDFLDLENNETLLIQTDDDEDGLTSAVQLKKFLINKGKKVNVYFNEKRSLMPGSASEDEIFYERFSETKPDLLIFLDLNEDITSKNIKKIDKAIPILIIDHHPSPENIEIENKLLVIKPTLYSDLKPSQYSTTKLVFDFFNGDELCACVGLIGDSAYDDWQDFIKYSSEKNNISIDELKKISDIIKAFYSVKGDKHELFNFVFENGINKIIGSEYEKKAQEFIDLVESETKRFETDAEIIDDADIAFFKTKKGLPSKLSNTLSKIHSQTLVIYSQDEYIKGSVRRNDYKVNAGKLIKYATSESDTANGGGHIPAGGFACLNDYWETFKKRAIEYAKNNPAKEALI